MVRVPSSLVGLLLALALNALVFVMARVARQPELLTTLLPLCAFAAGLLAARWGNGTSQLPGFGVGLLTLATRIGLALGLGLDLLAFTPPALALLELLAAQVGAMLGTIGARRAIGASRGGYPSPKPLRT
jgi:hypothetical protein